MSSSYSSLQPVVWISEKDAARIGLVDNDWVEVYNDNGVMVTRAAVSSRVQPGTCMIYHAPERTLTIPKSQVRGNRRRGNVDRGFVMSDHVDWDGLLTTIRQTGAMRICATHGYSEVLARYLREQGMDACVYRTRFSDKGEDESESDLAPS